MGRLLDAEGFARWLTGEGYRASSVRKLTTDLRSYCSRPELAAEPRSVQRARDYWRACAIYCEYALETGAPPLPVEPAPKPVPAEPTVRRVSRRKRRQRLEQAAIERSQWEALLAHLRASREPTDLVLRVMAETALRASDVLRTRRAVLQVGFAREDGLFELELKGGKRVLSTVHAAPEAWAQLLALMERRRASNVARAVSRSTRVDRGPAYQALVRRFRELCGELGVRGRHNLHRIRRTVAVRLREAGVSEADVQEVLGHAHVRTTRHYTSEYKAQLVAQALAKVSEGLGR